VQEEIYHLLLVYIRRSLSLFLIYLLEVATLIMDKSKFLMTFFNLQVDQIF